MRNQPYRPYTGLRTTRNTSKGRPNIQNSYDRTQTKGNSQYVLLFDNPALFNIELTKSINMTDLVNFMLKTAELSKA
jgi:hypothetical protein